MYLKNPLGFGLLLLLLLFWGQGRAQPLSDSTNVRPINPDRIEVLADGYTDSIVIRWAPTSPIVWQLGNKKGYRIERLTIHQNGEFNERAEEEKITLIDGFIPESAEVWNSIVQDNEQAAIVQEMIYGEQEQPLGTDWVSAMKRYQELNQRYGFALFVCDFYPVVAQAAALRWVDHKIQPGARYIYRVSLAEQTEGLEADGGAVVVSIGERFRTPGINRLAARFADRSVHLSWPLLGHNGRYSAYRIERSTDSVLFSSVSELPFSPMSTEEEQEQAFFTDSIPENGVQWYYRVVGLTPFGTEGSPSTTVKGMGRLDFQARPVIDTLFENIGGGIELRWHIEEDSGAVAKHINVYRSTDYDGSYTLLNPSPLMPDVSSWSDASVSDYSLYYRVEVLGDKMGEQALSSPRFIQLADSIPPLPPTGLSGKIALSGRVDLVWNKNPEPDLFGFRVFRANSLNEEFTEACADILIDTLVTDSINLYTLSSKIYYKLVALDKRYNTSDYSEVLELVRPDTIPPVPPQITRSGIDKKNSLFLYWEYGTSADVAGYELYRICKDSLTEVLQESWPPNPLRVYYADSTAAQGFTYQFRLVAIDNSGNRASSLSRELYYETGVRPAITDIRAKAHPEKKMIQLEWKYIGREKIDRYLIYKRSPNEPMVLYRTVQGSETLMYDKDVIPNNKYVYSIKALFVNGLESSMSKKIEVKY